MLTPLQMLYNSAYWAGRPWAIIIAVIGTAIFLALTLLIFSRRGKKAGCVVALVVIGLSVWVNWSQIPKKLEKEANYAITAGWESAKDQLTYANEMLFGYVYDYVVEPVVCEHSTWSAADTNCEYVVEEREWVVDGEDEDGNEEGHYEYDYWPIFKYEERKSIIAGIYEQNIIDFGQFAPESGERWTTWMGIAPVRIPRSMDIVYSHPDFDRARAAVDAGQRLPIAVGPHRYKNYFHANPASLKLSGLPSESEIARYEAAGLVAELEPIDASVGYSFDFEPVHFVGSLAQRVPMNEQELWQVAGRDVSGYDGPNLEAFTFIVLADEAEVAALGSIDNLALVTKASLMSETKYGMWRIPKNTMGLVCSVSYGSGEGQISECAFFQGMFSGNETLAVDIRALAKDVPFTPQAFFGQVNGSVIKGVEFDATRTGGLFDLIDDEAGDRGFHRTEMGPNDYLMSSVTPTPEQVKALVRAAAMNIAKAWMLWYFLLNLVAACVAYGSISSTTSSSRRRYYR